MPNEIDLGSGHKLWNIQDPNLGNKLSFYLAKRQVELIQHYTVWPKLLTEKKWTAKQGTVMRAVRKEPSPMLRSELIPNTLASAAKKDVIELQETKEEAQLYHQKVESQLIHYTADFQDFLDNANAANEDISQKISYLPDVFYRTAIFHGSPRVWIAGHGPVDAPYWTGSTISKAKDAATIVNWGNVLGTSTLTLNELHRILQYFYNDIRATPFTGKQLPDGTDGKAIAYKYLLITDNEQWQNFQHDPWLTSNRELNLDIVTGGFTGSLWGQLTSKFENFALRYKAGDGTAPAPETVEMGANAYNKGETIPNPDYIGAAANIGVAFLVGADAYSAIRPGPPPAPFASGSLTLDKFNGMDWNGKVSFNRNILIKTLDESGNVDLDTNSYGEYLRLQGKVTMGIIPNRRRNIIPILYHRARVAT